MDQPNNESGISSLLPELMEKIFEFLPFKERLAASRTCKTWYQLAFSPKFCRQMLIDFTTDKVTFGNVRAYQNYRNARVSANVCNETQSAIAEFFKAAPLESLFICGKTKYVKSLLDDHLLSMNQLTTLKMAIDTHESWHGDVIRISHPSLKCFDFGNSLGNIIFEINCPSLTDLSISCMTPSDCKKAVQLVMQLQQQLKSLNVDILSNEQLETLANAKLNNLKKLQLYIESSSNGIELFLNKITNLEELQLVSDNHHVLQIGEKLDPLKRLSKLSLLDMDVAMAEFELALRKMENLKVLDLNGCRFIPLTQPWHITSDHFRKLTVFQLRGFPVMLPHCPKLKSLKWLIEDGEIDDILVRACNSYPQLESLHLGATNHARFSSPTSFTNIKKLKLLKELHFTNLFLDCVNWTECSGMRLEKLQLNNCAIMPVEKLLGLQLIGPRLQQLFLNRCNQRFTTFPISETFVELLRKRLPWCKISCEQACEGSDDSD